MFNNLGWAELMMLLLFGLVIFGPDQLPKIAGDLGRMIRQLRRLADDTSADLRKELGPEFRDVDLASLNPRKFIEKHVLADLDDDEPLSSSRSGRVAAARSSAEAAATPLPEPTQAPYDADAT